MNIRSITVFCDPGWPVGQDVLGLAGRFVRAARRAFESAGYTVQTTRLATIPFPVLLKSKRMGEAISLAQELEAWSLNMGFDYVSIGPALPGVPESFHVLPELLMSTRVIFASGLMTQEEQYIDLDAVRACAGIIHQVGQRSDDGFDNLRFAALARVLPGAPFFPAAYHGSVQTAFALALEAADLGLKATASTNKLREVQAELVRLIENESASLVAVVHRLVRDFPVEFGGLDFSLAPFPDESRSIGTAIEKFGVPAVGLSGSLAVVALLTDCLERANFPHTGFNGVMLPVLEDATLAGRVIDGTLTVSDLLLYSAICGTGLDTIPLPGDTSPEQLEAVLLDVAALAQRLGKPLTARLLPVPGKHAGEMTSFDFPYFTNSRIMALPAKPLGGILTGGGRLELQTRQSVSG